jgi:hypothetical protein
MSGDVVLSYSSEDWLEIAPMCDELSARGAQLWIDQAKVDKNMDWKVEVRSAIESAPYVLLAVSSHWRDSLHCQFELSCARDRPTPLVAVAVAQHLPRASLQSLLAGLNATVVHERTRAQTLRALARKLQS